MKDLFSLHNEFQSISMVDADVSLLHEIDIGSSYDRILGKLIDETIWRQEHVRIFGNEYQQPRLVSLYGDPGRKYDYSGISLQPFPWTNLLLEIRRKVEECTEATFNAVFLNLY